ncbi:hypothetical protein BABINDRAFT_5803 [Babjeviella inositovora NRRL Y-12698]|uniref:Vacuolar membrane-associated protein IML1 n=1 Tax=Babjeviella inositovora NRRL Y-12698 TaxID=984486 RepID=A0A1E3QZ40_9ASCO|nr:uncharacterized protein BABINDRAFT_5803 [Babjeviella inositovora NRRL Y-12698]ODQ82908.1 hypothetical protein BABINDRAFT_5803 [Babjeviella inositovora NRRL Y-12698]
MAKLTLRLAGQRKHAAAPGRTPMGVQQSTLTVSRAGVSARFDTSPAVRANSTREHHETAHGSARELNHDGREPDTRDSSREPTLREPVQLNVWFHDPRTDLADVLIDTALLPGAKDGDVAELEPLNSLRKLLFRVTAGAKPNMVSVQSGALQTLMELTLRSPVLVRLKQPAEVEADLVEIQIKDMYLSRGDMWHFSSILQGQCVYRSKKVALMDGIRVTVNGIYRRKQKVFSAYVGPATKVVFRLESARLTFLIQVSREMWHFEESGEILFQKLIHTVLPTIFKRWQEIGTHHLITIVLFANVDITNTPWGNIQPGELFAECTDYFRVVVDQVHLTHWSEIMGTLRYEFSRFMRDLLLVEENGCWRSKGKFLPAVKGNLLEAINLTASIVTDNLRDPDLRHTNNQFIVVTPGTGIFDVDYDLMVRTSEKMLALEVGVDIICLSQPPLHAVPLFRYLRDGTLCHCIPTWIDASFCSSTSRNALYWTPRCKIYELQMMGVMANDASVVAITLLAARGERAMEEYDRDVFSSVGAVSTRDRTSVHARERLNGGTSRTASLSRASSTLTLASSLSNSLTLGSPRASVPVTGGATLTTSPVFSSPTHIRTGVSAMTALRQLAQAPSESSKLRSPSPTAETEPARERQPVREPQRTRVLPAKGYASKPAVKHSGPADVTSILFTPIDNPSRSATSLGLESYGRWQHTFPRHARKQGLKWRSLTSPAALPLTTPVFPAPVDFQQNYTFQLYDVLLNWDSPFTTSTLDLFRAMVYMRLTRGFQLCVGPGVARVESERAGGNPAALTKYLPSRADCHGARVYMSSVNEIHRIACDHGGSINVQVYSRVNLAVRPAKSGEADLESQAKSGITISASLLTPDDPNLAAVLPAKSLDENILPATPLDETIPPVIPVDEIPWTAPQAAPSDSLSISVPLIKTRYSETYTPSPLNPLMAIPCVKWNQVDQVLAGFDDVTDRTMYNRIKFVVIPCELPVGFAAGDQGLNLEELRLEGFRKLIGAVHKGRCRTREEQVARKKEEIAPEITFYTGSLFSFLTAQAAASETSHLLFADASYTRGMQLASLARALQSAKGIAFLDRRWHFSSYKHCFMGLEFTTWMVEMFEDIDTREDAVEFGNALMERGFFRHVTNRHNFLDGHYFYQLDAAYAETARTRDENADKTEETVSSTSSPASPAPAPAPTVMLSSSLDYNVDPTGKSFKLEVVRVHYDRVHNPEHCFHLRLEWLNTTSKLIDDTVLGWSRLCERYGLRLVEIPWREVCTVPSVNPFHSYAELTLALDPWTDAALNDADGTRLLAEQQFFYHIYLLESSGFMLDNRSGVFFNKESIEVNYSWGKPTFKYAQYIHRSGVYFAEIRTTGDLFLAPNNYHIARVNSGSGAKESFINSHRFLLDFRAKCGDRARLREIFLEAKSKWIVTKRLEETISQ